jgi:hemin uptake protein HemP
MKYKCPKCGKVSKNDWVDGVKVYHDCTKEYNDFKSDRLLHECVSVPDIEVITTDAAVVERFNELVNEGKIILSAQTPFGDCGYFPVERNGQEYRLRPTPRYRPFTDGKEAAQQLGRPIKYGGVEYKNWCVDLAYVIAKTNVSFGFVHGFRDAVFTDTGEPFGVKED